jgi:hypothetical protein
VGGLTPEEPLHPVCCITVELWRDMRVMTVEPSITGPAGQRLGSMGDWTLQDLLY